MLKLIVLTIKTRPPVALVDEPCTQYNCQNVTLSPYQPGNKPATRTIYQPGDKPATRTICQPGDKPATRLINQPGNKPATRIICQPGNKSGARSYFSRESDSTFSRQRYQLPSQIYNGISFSMCVRRSRVGTVKQKWAK